MPVQLAMASIQEKMAMLGNLFLSVSLSGNLGHTFRTYSPLHCKTWHSETKSVVQFNFPGYEGYIQLYEEETECFNPMPMDSL